MRSHELPVLENDLRLIWLSGSDGHRVAEDAINQSGTSSMERKRARRKAGRIFDIELLDSTIITPHKYVSLHEIWSTYNTSRQARPNRPVLQPTGHVAA